MIKLKVTVEWANGAKTEQQYAGLAFALVAMQVFNAYRSIDHKQVHRIIIENVSK